jgi:hypothetical protein
VVALRVSRAESAHLKTLAGLGCTERVGSKLSSAWNRMWLQLKLDLELWLVPSLRQSPNPEHFPHR